MDAGIVEAGKGNERERSKKSNAMSRFHNISLLKPMFNVTKKVTEFVMGMYRLEHIWPFAKSH
jgi:hypothetical protein